MVDKNRTVARSIQADADRVSEVPWQQLRGAVHDAVQRLEAAGWPGGIRVSDDLVIWRLPSVFQPVGGNTAELAFDAEGRLLGWASRIQEWYEPPSGWEYYAHVGKNEAPLAMSVVSRICPT